MKQLLVLSIICSGLLLAGCGVVDTPGDHYRRCRNITDLNARMGVDDHYTIWMYDRPSYLSYWYVRAPDFTKDIEEGEALSMRRTVVRRSLDLPE